MRIAAHFISIATGVLPELFRSGGALIAMSALRILRSSETGGRDAVTHMLAASRAAEGRHRHGPTYRYGDRRDCGARSCTVESDQSAGSGFLIVLALVVLWGVPLYRAVGALPVSIAGNPYTGFAGYAGSVVIRYPMMGIFPMIAVTAAMAFAGTALLNGSSAEPIKAGLAGVSGSLCPIPESSVGVQR